MIGYDKSAEIAKESLKTGKTVRRSRDGAEGDGRGGAG